MRSILFFTESLGGGGAEAALENIVTFLDTSRFTPHVLSVTDGEARTERVRAHCAYRCFTRKSPTGSALRALWNRVVFKFAASAPISLVRRLFVRGRYDIEVACCEGYAARFVAASRDPHAKKVAWIHTDMISNPWSESVYAGGAAEEKACYAKFDAIVCVSETMRDAFVQKYGFADKVHLIHNIVDDEAVRKKSEAQSVDVPCRPHFVMVGNLRQVKGYDRAVRVFARLHSEGYDFSVRVIGEGDERAAIERQLRESGLEETVELAGFCANPFAYVRAADAYICASYAEGYSTSVTEAVILGVPVITTECSGMREIFGEEECGIICENSDDGLYRALKRALDEPQFLTHCRTACAARAQAFSRTALVRDVESFLETV